MEFDHQRGAAEGLLAAQIFDFEDHCVIEEDKGCFIVTVLKKNTH